MTNRPLKHVVNEYLVHCEETGSTDHTVKAYRSRLHRFVEFVGPMRDAPTSPELIYGYLEHVRDGGDGKRPASMATVIHAHYVLRSFYRHLERRRIVSFNPMLHVESPAPSVDADDRPKTITAEQLDLLLDTALYGWTDESTFDRRTPNRKVEDHIVIGLLGLVGLSPDELLSLRQSDVRGETVRITTRRARTVPLPLVLQRSLMDYVPPVEQDHLFGNPSDPRKPLGSHALIQRTPRLAKYSGITDVKVTPRLLRDTCLSNFLAAGDMRVAMSLSGLSSQALQRYLPDHNPLDLSDPRTERLHPFIRDKVSARFQRGDFAGAVERAAKAVAQYLADRAQLPGLDGDPLITRALGPESGVLRVNDGRSKSDRNEAKGFLLLVQGFNMHVRNVHAHSLDVDVEEEHAVDYLSTASMICRVIDGARLRDAA